MKNLILLLVLFGNSFITQAFSQTSPANDLTLHNDQTSNQHYQLEKIIPVLSTAISYSKADTTNRDTTKKSFWESLLDFSFLNKLSGPGPFVGIGVDYPAFKLSKNFTVFVGLSFSHSIDNKLKYYRTLDSVFVPSTNQGGTWVSSFDSCISCEKSKAVEMVSVKIEMQYHIPRSPFDLYLGGTLHTFFGETFKSFSRGSGSFGAGWHALKCIQFGLMVNVFKEFKPSSFGAVDDSDSKDGVEFVPGAFVKVNLF